MFFSRRLIGVIPFVGVEEIDGRVLKDQNIASKQSMIWIEGGKEESYLEDVV